MIFIQLLSCLCLQIRELHFLLTRTQKQTLLAHLPEHLHPTNINDSNLEAVLTEISLVLSILLVESIIKFLVEHICN